MLFRDVSGQLRDGLMVRRTSWPEGTFIFRQVPAIISKTIVPGMQSLPAVVKEEFLRRFKDDSYQVSEIYYNDQIAIVNASNLIQGWGALPVDLLAEDWTVYYVITNIIPVPEG